MIEIIKVSEWGVRLKICGKKFAMRTGDVFVDGRVVKKCGFCGRDYDEKELDRTMREQAPQRDPRYFCFSTTKYCGLYCSWMRQKGMHRICGDEKVEKMKEDIAKRVAKYLKVKKGINEK